MGQRGREGREGRFFFFFPMRHLNRVGEGEQWVQESQEEVEGAGERRRRDREGGISGVGG